jgi:hypothetical protein
MADSPDWTDETLRPLDELARLAFPDGGVTGKTLRRRAREGKLAVYRPGKTYLATLSGVRVMIEKTRVIPAQERPPRPTSIVPISLGLTKMDLASSALNQLLEESRQHRREAKRLRDEERPDSRLRTACKRKKDGGREHVPSTEKRMRSASRAKPSDRITVD